MTGLEYDAGVASLDDNRMELASTGLLSSYDRLRARITTGIEQRGRRWGRATVETLLLVPDVFFLLARLVLDPRVPPTTRRFLAGALAYCVTPIDLLPEAIIGPIGYLDDLVLACAVLSTALASELEPLAEKYWSGSEKLRLVLRDSSQAAASLLGENLYRRLQELLARYGVKL